MGNFDIEKFKQLMRAQAEQFKKAVQPLNFVQEEVKKAIVTETKDKAKRMFQAGATGSQVAQAAGIPLDALQDKTGAQSSQQKSPKPGTQQTGGDNSQKLIGALLALSEIFNKQTPGSLHLPYRERMQKQQQSGTKGVYGFDPGKRTVTQVGEVPKGADVRNVTPSFDDMFPGMPKSQENIQAGELDPVSQIQIPEGMEISGYDYKYGKMIPKFKKRVPTEEEKGRIKIETEMRKSKLSSQHNLQVTSEVANDLTKRLVAGYVKGGAGDIYQAAITKIVGKGIIPKQFSEHTKQYAEAGTIVGKRTEMLLKMFPMLTQQLGKPGSIRLIQSIIDRVGQTLPDTNTPQNLAYEQLYSTLKSMYRISRAVTMLDLKQLNPATQDSFTDIIVDATTRVELGEEEEMAMNKLIGEALKPLGKHLGIPSVGEISIDEETGEKFIFTGGDPEDPKNWRVSK